MYIPHFVKKNLHPDFSPQFQLSGSSKHSQKVSSKSGADFWRKCHISVSSIKVDLIYYIYTIYMSTGNKQTSLHHICSSSQDN